MRNITFRYTKRYVLIASFVAVARNFSGEKIVGQNVLRTTVITTQSTCNAIEMHIFASVNKHNPSPNQFIFLQQF